MTKTVGDRVRGVAVILVVIAMVGYLGYLKGQAAAKPEFLIAEQAPDHQDDEGEAAVRRVLDAQVAAWNKGDLKGFMAGYWQSADLRFFSGKDVTRGWQSTLERYQKRYQAEGKEMGKLTFSDLDIHVASPTSAWARGRWRVVTSKEKLGGLFTLILKKVPDGWRIIHDHTSAG
jgi:beta-aspartyl-peptidase (threonine type)